MGSSPKQGPFLGSFLKQGAILDWDDLPARTWSAIGLDPDKSGTLPGIYKLSNMVIFVGNMQTRLAAYDACSASLRKADMQSLAATIESLNKENVVASAYEKLLYSAPAVMHCSHRTKLAWFRFGKNELPRVKKGQQSEIVYRPLRRSTAASA